MSDIKTVTDVYEQPFKKLPVNTQIANNEMYQRIDQVLVDSIGSSMTFTQLVKQIQHKDVHAYDWVIGRSQRILKPTYVLS
jgi:UDP-N-acetyl-D-mannosaminuronic acid transferase (WecB/TagA/CpsF family)